MKTTHFTYIKYISFVCFAVLASSVYSRAEAASTPTLLLVPAGNGSVQVSVSGADPSAVAILYYPPVGSSSGSFGLGLTNSGGSLSAIVNPSTYGIGSGSSVYVIVDGARSATVSWPSSSLSSSGLSLSQNVLNLSAGQSGTIAVSNAVGTVSISTNTNPSVAIGTVISGSVVVTAYSNPGTTVMTICDTTNTCQNLNVSVLSSAISSFSLSATTANLIVGQSQTVTMTGIGPFSISQNSNPSAVSASVSGNNLVLTGVGIGGSAITVCQSGSQCIIANVYSNPGSAGNPASASPSTQVNSTSVQSVPASTVAQVQPPTLSSVTISTNGTKNAFIGSGATVTLTLNVNQSVSTMKVSINGTQVSLSGSGSGPYTASYLMTGDESMPLPVSAYFTNSSGIGGQAYFWISNYSTPISSPATAASSAATSAVSHSFTRYLYVGMTPLGTSDPDVLALQQRLKTDGFFSGPVTGYFGPITKAAVEAYQTAHGFSAVGVVGPSTRDLLNSGI